MHIVFQNLHTMDYDAFANSLTGEEKRYDFKEIERLGRGSLPKSAYKYVEWWSNSKTHPLMKRALEAGYMSKDRDLKSQRITFYRDRAGAQNALKAKKGQNRGATSTFNDSLNSEKRFVAERNGRVVKQKPDSVTDGNGVHSKRIVEPAERISDVSTETYNTRQRETNRFLNPTDVKPKAFISHTEMGGSDTAKLVQRKLTSPNTGMAAFASTEIACGKDLVKTILENIIESDVLVFIVDSETPGKPWMKWEYTFCKKRGMLILPIALHDMHDKLSQIRYLDDSINLIKYDRDKDLLQSDIRKAYDDNRDDLESSANRRYALTIDTEENQTNCYPSGTITISGKVTGKISDNGPSRYDTDIYLHIPQDIQKPPLERHLGKFDIEQDGKFSAQITLPPESKGCHTLYAEIRINKTARLIQINTDLAPAHESTRHPSDDTDMSHDPNPPRNRISSSNLQKIRQVSKGNMTTISRKIGGEEMRRTDKVNEIIRVLDGGDRVVVTGDKGSGKSVALCQAYERLADKHERVLFVRCDGFLDIDSVNDLEKILGDGPDLSTILNNTENKDDKTILLLDSLDAISRNTKTIGIFRRFLHRVWGTGKVKTVCSVRSYDYEYSPLINTTDWGKKVEMGELPDDLVENTLKRLGIGKVPDPLRKILGNPLRLNLLDMIIKSNKSVDLTRITDEVKLYDEHWKEYVEKQRSPGQTTRVLFEISRRMMETQTMAIEWVPDNPDQDAMDSIRSRGIIKIDKYARFFHDAYLDYVASRYMLSEYPDMLKFLRCEEYNVFFRPTFKFALSMLYNMDRSRYLTTVIGICKSDLKYYWKASALGSIAELGGFDDDKVADIGDMLKSDPLLQLHFLAGATRSANRFWLEAGSGSFIEDWFADANGGFLVDYLKSIAGHDYLHGRMLHLIRLLVDKENDPMLKHKAIVATARMHGQDKAAWYKELSCSAESRVRSGIVNCLPDLLESDPDAVPAIFKNVCTYRETSQEKTPFVSYGPSLTMTSNKSQDNYHVIWEAGELFPKLFEKNPKIAVSAAILSVEEIKRDYLRDTGADIVEDYSLRWYNFSKDEIDTKIINTVKDGLGRLSRNDADMCVPLLRGARIAVFHRVLLDYLLDSPEQFTDLVYSEISDPAVLKINALEPAVRKAIKKTSGLLAESKRNTLLDNIMNISFPHMQDSGRRAEREDRLKAIFLSEFDRDVLTGEQLTLLDRCSKKELEPKPSHTFTTTTKKSLDTQPPKPTLAESSDRLLAGGLDRETVLTNLDVVVEHLGKERGETDNSRFADMQKCLLELAVHDDPQENATEEKDHLMIIVDTVRGVVAKGLIRLYFHTRDRSLREPIRLLSSDGINTVRGEVARELQYLFVVDCPLTRDIIMRYSKDPDYRVRFFLPDAIDQLVNEHADDALEAIRNMFAAHDRRDQPVMETVWDVVLFLALKKDNGEAVKILTKELGADRSNGIMKIPFMLKEMYLFADDSQNDALRIFSTLLDHKDPEVREKASFFLLCSIKDEVTDNGSILAKIRTHLDKIANEVGKEQCNPRTVENLLQFLKEHWMHMRTDDILEYLEVIFRSEEYFEYQPTFMNSTVVVLNGILRRTPLIPADRDRCLSILDVFVKAGWPEALKLLDEMERPD